MRYFLFFSLVLTSTAFAQKNFREVAGIELYSFRNTLKDDVDAGLKMIKDLGIREVECYNFGPKYTGAADLRKRLDQHGLKAIGWAADFKTLQDPAALTQAIADAKTLGAPFIVTFWIDHAGKEFTLDDTKKAVEVFNKAGREIQKAGLQFAYHVHGYEFQSTSAVAKGTLFDYLYQNTDPTAVQFELDTFWAHWGGMNPVDFLRRYGKRTPLMHLKDCVKGVKGDKTGAAPVEYDVPLGTGQVDIAGALREARKQRTLKHYLIEDESASVPGSIEKSLNYLASLPY